MHAERDIVVPIPSVCLSVQCRYFVYTNTLIVIVFFRRTERGIILVDPLP